ncbi:4-hydroxy-tetrahydrodipicolinate reductase [Haloimpatiens massiliensis]|uniref:4-hydroxy-tetrahydrodipicolinate reductase n=1 Tax=Haloimpatiens massiliensis TaxID=1658110 RepID=UPI000C849E45|nr:4-hydroxy-tetrahydrodipicolinate reductase [Haloimpatiens massiliensis]
MTKILLSGCNGKMGRMISQTITNFKDLEICGGIDKNIEKTCCYPVFGNINDCNLDFDVILDFSRADALDSLLNYAEEKNKPLVLCTTGYTEEQINKINEWSKKIPLFRSANMSIGINVINNVLRNISALLYEDFDIEIIEKHHNQKVDAPSGTALLLGDTIRESIKEETQYKFGRSGISKREEKEIGVHAIRGGSIVGEHEIIFAGNGEVIELKHTALSREVFAVGALKACKFMCDKTPGLYSMDHVLNTK